MCFSATASFVASGVLATIGVATLRHVREPRALLFASVPLLFAGHQFCEGLVWLAFHGELGQVTLDRAVLLFMLYALGVLPTLMPVAVALMEPQSRRRIAIVALTVAGTFVCVWNIAGLILFPIRAFVEHSSIAYRNAMTSNMAVSIVYIMATCGALLLSSHSVVRTYGIVNIIGLTLVHLIKGYAFASVWCFYAAILSITLYWQFHRRKIDFETSNGASTADKPFVRTWLRGART
ncbi:DUF6629 family protein [Sphingomonas sp. M1A8_2b]